MQSSYGQISYKINAVLINNTQCNVISKFLNPTKRAKIKNIHYLTILQGCINTGRGKAKFQNFRILLDRGVSSTIVMNNLKSRHKCKNSTTTAWQTQDGVFTAKK